MLNAAQVCGLIALARVNNEVNNGHPQPVRTQVKGMPKKPEIKPLTLEEIQRKILEEEELARNPPPLPPEQVGYWRVSTGRDQDPAYQIDLLKKYGVPDDNILGDVKSGAVKRKGLDRALRLMHGRPGWTLVIWKLDRLGRDAAELYQLMNLFQAQKWNLVSLTEGIDTSTPMGRAFFGMLAVFAQFERDTIKERTRAGMKHLKEAGVELGRVTNITPAQFKDIERRLLAKDGETIKQIADSHKISTSTVNHHFPKWRSLTLHQRKLHRASHPLPTQRSGPVHKARRRHPRRNRKQ